jgi:hypothetical protein
MKNKISQKPHSLEKYFNGYQKSSFLKIDANNGIDFPKLNEEVIQQKIALGSYQLKNCRSYLAEHFDSNGTLEILINRIPIKDHENTILLASIQSRHIERMKYDVVIAFKPKIKDVSSIYAWNCTCKIGKRSVGCCSHVASIIFYLSFGMYEKDLKKPGVSLNRLFKISDENENHTDDFC